MLSPGDPVRGKWTGCRVEVIRLLGTGANGSVYLVRAEHGLAAMKVCPKAEDAALEWGLLGRAGRSSPRFPTPIAIDDDRDRQDAYFYLMEPVPGRPLGEALPLLSEAAAYSALAQALAGLRALHQMGYAFCDVKPENLLVAGAPAVSLRFVDVGGVTAFGRSVRQFTPFYDRGFWGLGGRTADPAYDLAAIAFAWLLTLGKAPPPGLHGVSVHERQDWLWKAIRSYPDPALRPWLLDLTTGQVQSAEAAAQALSARTGKRRAGQAGQSHSQPLPNTRSHGPAGASWAGAPASTRPRGSRRRATCADWTEWVMWASLGTAAALTIAAWESVIR